MRLVVVSHKLVWESEGLSFRFSTDGGFPFQIKAISELFDTTTLVVPSSDENIISGLSPLVGKNLRVAPLRAIKGHGLRRKMGFPGWLMSNGSLIWKEVRSADAVHAVIPGDVGTIGMLFAILTRKPLFVRHCGNWFVQRTWAERFWKWSMEYFGGGINVMLATGGSQDAPSKRNKSIKWIFSTSLNREQIESRNALRLPEDGRIRLVIVCRQEQRKGTDVVIRSMPDVLKMLPNVSLDVVGDGSRLAEWKLMAESLGLAGKITFHGKLEHSEVLNVLRQSNIFCFPTDASEGFPKVVLEALASGVPVISTRVSVLPELMKSGCGIVIERPTAADLAAAVVELCSDADRYHVMSTQAIETATQYSLESWKEGIDGVLRNAWGAKSLSSGI